MQGNYLGMDGINKKLSHTIMYNWNVNDDLIKFCIRARLNIIPTNFNIFIWNRDHDPKCYFCQHKTESTAHVLNGCYAFRNFYSARHNRIVDEIFKFIKPLMRTYNCYKDQFIDNIFTTINFDIINRRPDILVVDMKRKICIMVEITVCYDLYLKQAFEQKIARYNPLCDILIENGFKAKLVVLCFGSLGTIMENVWSGLKYFQPSKIGLKELLKWCSISCIIGSNYIWRHRVKIMFTI